METVWSSHNPEDPNLSHYPHENPKTCNGMTTGGRYNERKTKNPVAGLGEEKE
jgi:hypothetical protein